MTRLFAQEFRTPGIFDLCAATVAVLATLISPVPVNAQARIAAPTAIGSSAVAKAASVAFAPPLLYGTNGFDPGTVVVADLNGDGKPDLIATNGGGEAEGTVAVMLGNGDGTFQPAVTYDSGGTWAKAIAVADLNGDGKLDVIVANLYPSGWYGQEVNGVVSVLFGNGDGSFKPAVVYDAGAEETFSVAVADVNGDGKLDVLLVNTCLVGNCEITHVDGGVSVMLGNGDGTLQPAVTYDGGGMGSAGISVGDVNGDGFIDLLVANSGVVNGDFSSTGSIAVLFGNGDGTFQAAVTYNTGGNTPYAATIADVNGDGHPDIIAVNSCWCGSDSSVAVLLGNGDGTFQTAVTYDTGGQDAISIAVADLNDDGHPDLVVGNLCADRYCDGDSRTGVLLGNGDGTFQPVALFDSGLGTSSVAIADVNGDKRLDLVTGDEGWVGVVLNNTSSNDATTTTIVSKLNPSVFGQPITFTARVRSASGTPTGIVVFDSNAPQNPVLTQLGTGVLVKGVASLSTTALPAGTQSITASYLGSTSFVFSTSAVRSEAVNPASTTISMVSSANPITVNHAAIYTATILGQYGGAATGTVTFQDGGSTIATVGISSSNQATYRVLYKTVGTHAITATYSGDGNNTGSNSATLTEDIEGTTKTVVSTSGSPSSLGNPVTFTATVTSSYGAIPNGEVVTFYDSAKVIGTGTTTGSLASFTTSSLIVKTHTIKATYPGDGTFEPSMGKVTQVVSQ
jgi:hypothetical protein